MFSAYFFGFCVFLNLIQQIPAFSLRNGLQYRNFVKHKNDFKMGKKGSDFVREIRPSETDKARTIAHICGSGTLCTTSTMSDAVGYPFGSYVDYILNEKGWPVMLLSEQSLHTQNIKSNPAVSLFAQLPRAQNTQSTAALSRVTIMGTVSPVEESDETALKLAFSVLHPYAEQILDSNKFRLYHVQPKKIYFSGGFGVSATWVDVPAYERAKPDVLAHEVPAVLARLNTEKKGELLLVCKHFLGMRLSTIESVRVQAIDRLGIDIRVKAGDFTDEYRVGFRHPASSSEDVKSEMLKLFLEAWEREQGVFDQPGKKTPAQLYRDRLARRAAGGAVDGEDEDEEDHRFDVGDGLPRPREVVVSHVTTGKKKRKGKKNKKQEEVEVAVYHDDDEEEDKDHERRRRNGQDQNLPPVALVAPDQLRGEIL